MTDPVNMLNGDLDYKVWSQCESHNHLYVLRMHTTLTVVNVVYVAVN